MMDGRELALNELAAYGIMASSVCNLDCTYCYISKVPYLKKLQAQPIVFVPNNAESLTLWGGEPTLGLQEFIERWDEVERAYPKLKKIDVSTNQTQYKSLIDFMDFVHARNPDIEFSIQLSSDGVFSERNRGVPLKQYEKFTPEIVNHAPPGTHFHWKVTISADELLEVASDPQGFLDYFQGLYDKFEVPEGVLFDKTVAISLEVPGHYTPDDGRNFTKLIRNIRGVKSKDLRLSTIYHYRLHRNLVLGGELFVRHRMFTCSAGDSCYHQGRDGTLHLCHYSYFYPYDEYWQQVKEKGLEEYDIKEGGFADLIPMGEQINHLHYRAFHDFGRLQISITTATIMWLAKKGELNPKLKDPELASQFAMFVFPMHHCPMDAMARMGNWNMLADSVLKVFGNGAFEEIAKDVLG